MAWPQNLAHSQHMEADKQGLNNYCFRLTSNLPVLRLFILIRLKPENRVGFIGSIKQPRQAIAGYLVACLNKARVSRVAFAIKGQKPVFALMVNINIAPALVAFTGNNYGRFAYSKGGNGLALLA